MPRINFARQHDIFDAIDQAIDDAVDRGMLVEDPPPIVAARDVLVERGTLQVTPTVAYPIERYAVGRVVHPPDGDTAAMSPGQLHEWCRAAETRCQLAFNVSSDPAWCPRLLDARDFYFRCRTLLQLSLERTYAHLFLLPWQRQVAALPDVETARAIEFVQGRIQLDSATTETARHRAGALVMGAGSRLARLGLIDPDAPVAVRDGTA